MMGAGHPVIAHHDAINSEPVSLDEDIDQNVQGRRRLQGRVLDERHQGAR